MTDYNNDRFDDDTTTRYDFDDGIEFQMIPMIIIIIITKVHMMIQKFHVLAANNNLMILRTIIINLKKQALVLKF